MNKVRHINYPDCSVYDFLEQNALKYPKNYALDYFSKKITYKELIFEIDKCAKALKAIGINSNDTVSICLPNIPQAVILFYAINKIGAIANMIHPLSAENEVAYYLDVSGSSLIITLDLLWNKLSNVINESKIKNTVLVSVKSYMPLILKCAYTIKNLNNKSPKGILNWKQFIDLSNNYSNKTNSNGKENDCAAILYSGGTTGKPKGIMLTNLNFNALALQSIEACGCLNKGDRVLSIMPIFHGFGLGVCIHTVLNFGGTAIILPKFSPMEFHELLLKYKPNVIAGVPTIYEVMLQNNKSDNKDLSFIKCVISGGDSLSVNTKYKLNKFLTDHGCQTFVREGYGLTECVTGSCLMPDINDKFESVGLPYADTYYKIVSPQTKEEVGIGEIGEITINGPTVMLGYLNEPEETQMTLRIHNDKKVWLHTGDLGYIDRDGYVFFKQRLKRMIISNGYNIYPQNIENIIDSSNNVLMSAVVGIDDIIKGQKIKAFVVLKDSVNEFDEARREILELCEKNISRYSLPEEIVFVKTLPKTLVGKIAYNELMKGYHNG